MRLLMAPSPQYVLSYVYLLAPFALQVTDLIEWTWGLGAFFGLTPKQRRILCQGAEARYTKVDRAFRHWPEY